MQIINIFYQNAIAITKFAKLSRYYKINKNIYKYLYTYYFNKNKLERLLTTTTIIITKITTTTASYL